jgi:hypothetical protein
MEEIKNNTYYRVKNLDKNIGRIENNDIVETRDTISNLPFIYCYGVTHGESAYIHQDWLFALGEEDKKLAIKQSYENSERSRKYYEENK